MRGTTAVATFNFLWQRNTESVDLRSGKCAACGCGGPTARECYATILRRRLKGRNEIPVLKSYDQPDTLVTDAFALKSVDDCTVRRQHAKRNRGTGGLFKAKGAANTSTRRYTTRTAGRAACQRGRPSSRKRKRFSSSCLHDRDTARTSLATKRKSLRRPESCLLTNYAAPT